MIDPDKKASLQNLGIMSIDNFSTTFQKGDILSTYTPLIIENNGRILCFPLMRRGREDIADLTYTYSFAFPDISPTTEDHVHIMSGTNNFIEEFDGLTLDSAVGLGDTEYEFIYRKRKHINGEIVYKAKSSGYPATDEVITLTFSFDPNTQYNITTSIKITSLPYGRGIKYSGWRLNENGTQNPLSVNWKNEKSALQPNLGNKYYITITDYTRSVEDLLVRAIARRVSSFNPTASSTTSFALESPPSSNSNDLVKYSCTVGASSTEAITSNRTITYTIPRAVIGNYTDLPTDLQDLTINDIESIKNADTQELYTNYVLETNPTTIKLSLRWYGYVEAQVLIDLNVYVCTIGGISPQFLGNTTSDSSIKWDGQIYPYLDTFQVPNLWESENEDEVGIFYLVDYDGDTERNFMRIKCTDNSDGLHTTKYLTNPEDWTSLSDVRILMKSSIQVDINTMKFFYDQKNTTTGVITRYEYAVSDIDVVDELVETFVSAGVYSSADNVIAYGFKILDSSSFPSFDIYEIWDDNGLEYIESFTFNGYASISYYKAQEGDTPNRGRYWDASDQTWVDITEVNASWDGASAVASGEFSIDPSTGIITLGDGIDEKDTLEIQYFHETTINDSFSVLSDQYMRYQDHKVGDLPESTYDSITYLWEQFSRIYKKFDSGEDNVLTNGEKGDTIYFGSDRKFRQVVVDLSVAANVNPEFNYQIYDGTSWKDITSLVNDITWTSATKQVIKLDFDKDTYGDWSTIHPPNALQGGVPLTDEIWGIQDYDGSPDTLVSMSTFGDKFPDSDEAIVVGAARKFGKIIFEVTKGVTSNDDLIIEFYNETDSVWQRTSNFVDGTDFFQTPASTKAGTVVEIELQLTDNERELWSTYDFGGGKTDQFWIRIRTNVGSGDNGSTLTGSTLIDTRNLPIYWISGFQPDGSDDGNDLSTLQSGTWSHSNYYIGIGAKNRFSVVRFNTNTGTGSSTANQCFISDGTPLENQDIEDHIEVTDNIFHTNEGFEDAEISDMMIKIPPSVWNTWKPTDLEEFDNDPYYWFFIKISSLQLDNVTLMTDKTLDTSPVSSYYLRATVTTAHTIDPEATSITLTQNEYWQDIGLKEVKYIYPIDTSGNHNMFSVVGIEGDVVKNMFSAIAEIDTTSLLMETISRGTNITLMDTHSLDLLGDELEVPRSIGETDAAYSERLLTESKSLASTENVIADLLSTTLSIDESDITFTYWWESGWILDDNANLYDEATRRTVSFTTDGTTVQAIGSYGATDRYIYDPYKGRWGNKDECVGIDARSSFVPIGISRVTTGDGSDWTTEKPKTVITVTNPSVQYITHEDVRWGWNGTTLEPEIHWQKQPLSGLSVTIEYYGGYNSEYNALNETIFVDNTPPVGGAYIYIDLDPILTDDGTPSSVASSDTFTFVANKERLIGFTVYGKTSDTNTTFTVSLHQDSGGTLGDEVYSLTMDTSLFDIDNSYVEILLDSFDYTSNATIGIDSGETYHIKITNTTLTLYSVTGVKPFARVYLAKKNSRELNGININEDNTGFNEFFGIIESKKPMNTFGTVFFTFKES
jgi:hypothetical protein